MVRKTCAPRPPPRRLPRPGLSGIAGGAATLKEGAGSARAAQAAGIKGGAAEAQKGAAARRRGGGLAPTLCDQLRGGVTLHARHSGSSSPCRAVKSASVVPTILRKSFLGDDAAVLARSSGEEPASHAIEQTSASMAWRTTMIQRERRELLIST